MNLEELIIRLKKSDNVLSVAVIGSASEDNLNPASDYDLLIVLKDMPLSITGGVTNLEGRFTDICFVHSEDIVSILKANENQIHISSMQGSILRWMKSARIEFDKSGHLELVQKRANGEDFLPNCPAKVRYIRDSIRLVITLPTLSVC